MSTCGSVVWGGGVVGVCVRTKLTKDEATHVPWRRGGRLEGRRERNVTRQPFPCQCFASHVPWHGGGGGGKSCRAHGNTPAQAKEERAVLARCPIRAEADRMNKNAGHSPSLFSLKTKRKVKRTHAHQPHKAPSTPSPQAGSGREARVPVVETTALSFPTPGPRHHPPPFSSDHISHFLLSSPNRTHAHRSQPTPPQHQKDHGPTRKKT